jgi:signal transduction histidine kinase
MQKRTESLKGRLQVHSKPGEGTKITLNLPVS